MRLPNPTTDTNRMLPVHADNSPIDAADRVLLGLAGTNADPDLAYALYGDAAAAGSALAAHRLAVLHALGVGRPPSWDEALACLRQAAHHGHATAARELQLVEGSALFPAASKVGVSQDPAIVTLEALVPPPVCRWLIEHGRGRLAPGRVNHISDGAPIPDPMRTARAAPFSLLDMDIVLAMTLERIARATGLHVHQFEPANLLHYAPGQEYKAHFDFINPAVPGFREQLSIFGQRIATALVYLNDDYDGGETAFPTLGFKFRGQPGDALVFLNVGANGQPHRASLHAGLPPVRGEKWVLSIWVRDRVQPIL